MVRHINISASVIYIHIGSPGQRMYLQEMHKEPGESNSFQLHYLKEGEKSLPSYSYKDKMNGCHPVQSIQEAEKQKIMWGLFKLSRKFFLCTIANVIKKPKESKKAAKKSKQEAVKDTLQESLNRSSLYL